MAVYAALYRTWRPRRLADLIGQDHVSRTLLNALAAGRPAHAYLFCGPRGTGKTSTARILAAALNCRRAAGGDACGLCEPCGGIAADRFLDVREVDAASNRQVDDMRALRETVSYRPSVGRHKVYILDEVHMLTEASWNTLLKTLEEPPPATTFVLCTTDPSKVLATVVSRCQRFDFRRLTEGEIAAHLDRVCRVEGVAVADGALAAIARRSEGGLRDALAVLDQATAFVPSGAIEAGDVARLLGSADDASIEALLQAARAADARTLFAEVARLYEEGLDMAQVLRDLLVGVRRGLVALLGEGAAGAGPAGEGVGWHLRAIGVLSEMEPHLRRSEMPRLLLEAALIRLLPGVEGGGAGAPAPAAQRVSQSGPRQGIPRPPESGQALPPPPESGQALPPAPESRAPDPPVAGEAGASEVAVSQSDPPWPEVLEAVRRISTPAHAAFEGAEVQGRRGAVVRLAFRYSGQAHLAEGRRDILERAWASVSGQRVSFEFTAPATREPSAQGQRAAESAGAGSAGRRALPPAEPLAPRLAAPGAGAAPSAGGVSGGVSGGVPGGVSGGVSGGVEEAFRRALGLFAGSDLAGTGEGSADGGDGGSRE